MESHPTNAGLAPTECVCCLCCLSRARPPSPPPHPAEQDSLHRSYDAAAERKEKELPPTAGGFHVLRTAGGRGSAAWGIGFEEVRRPPGGRLAASLRRGGAGTAGGRTCLCRPLATGGRGHAACSCRACIQAQRLAGCQLSAPWRAPRRAIWLPACGAQCSTEVLAAGSQAAGWRPCPAVRAGRMWSGTAAQ